MYVSKNFPTCGSATRGRVSPEGTYAMVRSRPSKPFKRADPGFENSSSTVGISIGVSHGVVVHAFGTCCVAWAVEPTSKPPWVPRPNPCVPQNPSCRVAEWTAPR